MDSENRPADVPADGHGRPGAEGPDDSAGTFLHGLPPEDLRVDAGFADRVERLARERQRRKQALLAGGAATTVVAAALLLVPPLLQARTGGEPAAASAARDSQAQVYSTAPSYGQDQLGSLSGPTPQSAPEAAERFARPAPAAADRAPGEDAVLSRCPPYEGPVGRVPAPPARPDALIRLVPSAVPSAGLVCRYESTKPGAPVPGAPLSGTDLTPEALERIAAWWSRLPASATEPLRPICAVAGAPASVRHQLVVLRYGEDVVHVAAPEDGLGCAGATNGAFSTARYLGAEVAELAR